jgi:uncharacterized membrane protein YgdD (TMEM256/DUF423 family)
MTRQLATRIAAIFGLLAVGLGAFGAHGLKAILQQHETVEIWEKAVLYHFIHAAMLFVLAQRNAVQRGPWSLFLAGILIFSGSLYLMAVTNVRWLGAITPLGGLCLLGGWLWLALKPSAHSEPRQ